MNPAIEASLTCWHEIIATGDARRLRSLLASDCIFRSPVAYQPYHGAERTERVLAAAASVFQDFRYHRQFVSGNDVGLEFSARVGSVELKGIDLIHFDDNGSITEFEVMVRPATGLQALGQEMARRLAEQP
ncbi:MAG TPA: nuclear transport factor 2 family protein [Burkholderiaceae bacterium]|nr:nuclear transport factor 2 family protein [Burkholderiaceae bacterium]